MHSHATELQLALDSDLVAAGWDGCVNAYPGQSVRNTIMMQQSKALLKKYRDELSPDAERNALCKFLKSNEICKSFKYPSASTEIEALLIGEFEESVYRFFSSPLFSRIIYERNFGLGPGASLGSPTTSFFSKTSNSELTFDKPELPMLFSEAIRSDLLWSSVEKQRSLVKPRRLVEGNVLSHVPKTREITRTICTEPLLNMLYQKGIGASIEHRLIQFFGIRLDSQPKRNSDFALQGSVSGSFATIDLESASDSVSMTLLDRILPPHVLMWLKIARCSKTVLPDRSVIDLHMVSSMGNAFTFPLQTAIFACVVAAVYRVRSITLQRCDSMTPNFGVFGDDIVVESECFSLTCRLLSLLGFRVNGSKSFGDGDFRESCGSDFFRGVNVRGCYLTTLQTKQDVYSAINRLNVWSARHDIGLNRLISYLRALLPRKVPFIPFWEADTSGLKVPLAWAKPKTNKNGSFVYYSESPVPISFPVLNCETRPPRIRGYFANPDGILMAAVAGYCFGGSLTVRPNGRVRYRSRRRLSPGWDSYDDGRDFPGFGHRWKLMTPLNLSLV